MDPRLSHLGQRISRLSGVRAINKDIAETLQKEGSHWIDLGAGNPVILPEVEAMWRRYTQELMAEPEFGKVLCRYGVSQGYGPLIEAVVDYFNREYGWGITRRNVLITPGSQSFYFFAVNVFCGLGTDGQRRPLLLPLSPDYTGYGGILIEESDLKAIPPTLEKQGSHTFKYRPDLERLQVDEQVGAILFSRPCNPTGNVITDEEVAQIVQRAAAADVPVIIDSAYAIPFPHLTYVPMSLTWADNVIHCFSLSKAGLPGERVGIAIGPEHLLQPVECFQANASIHSSQLGQAIAARAIRSGELAKLSEQVIRPHYWQKMERLQAAFGREFPDDLPWFLHRAEGALFAWLWLPDLPISDRGLYQRLKQEGVVVVPGSPFFPGIDPSWPHQYQCVRISLTATLEQIEQGVAILSQVVEQAYSRTPLRV